jgi:hypothetical protein
LELGAFLTFSFKPKNACKTIQNPNLSLDKAPCLTTLAKNPVARVPFPGVPGFITMAKTFRRPLTLSLLALATWLIAFSAVRTSANTIFNNSTNDLITRFDPGTLEVGDEIILAGTARYLTNFSFEFFATNPVAHVLSGSIAAEVRFYRNNGPLFNGYPTPGSMFFDSGLFAIGQTVRSTAVFTIGTGDFPSTGLFIPDSDITWSVQFSGMGANDTAGVDLYSPPTVGSDYPDYWQNNGGSWALMTNSLASQMNFGATFDASPQAVPEPSAIALSILGGLGLLAFARKFRRT